MAAIITIFGWAFFSFWSAIPAGIGLGVAPTVVVLTVTISYGTGAALVVVVGTPLRDRIQRRMSNKETSEPKRFVVIVQNAWNRYGMLGLSILAPMTVGSQMGAVIGLGFGARPWRLVVVMTLGAGVWAMLIALAVQAGIMTVAQI